MLAYVTLFDAMSAMLLFFSPLRHLLFFHVFSFDMLPFARLTPPCVSCHKQS